MTDKDILISDLNDISEILNNNGYGGWCATIRKAVTLLKEQEGNRWISVTERLPKSMANKVIVYLQHGDLSLAPQAESLLAHVLLVWPVFKGQEAS